MRNLTTEEKDQLLAEVTWGTLCCTQPDGTPYATEMTYLYQGTEVLCLSKSNGLTGQCIEHSPRVCFKVCEASRLSRQFRAVSLFGSAQFRTPACVDEMVNYWVALEARLRSPDKYLIPKKRCFEQKKLYPVLQISVDRWSGVTDWDVK